MILDNAYLTERQLALLLDISMGSTHAILLTKFGLVCVFDEFCNFLIEQVVNNADYLNNIITANETCIYCYDPMFKKLKDGLIEGDIFKARRIRVRGRERLD